MANISNMIYLFYKIERKVVQINLVTYPRSGSRFLRDLINQSANPNDLRLEFNHTPGYYDPEHLTVSVVRNPFDAILSLVSMDIHHFPDNDIEDLIKKRINFYILFNKDILENFDMWFNFDFLINNPSKVVDIIFKRAGIKRSGFEYIDMIVDRPDKRNLKTSKTSPYFNEVKDILKLYDLSKCEDLYRKLIDLSIKE